MSWKRSQASDSSDSGDEESDKMSVTSMVLSVYESEPDSGIGTWSNAGSGGSVSRATSGSSSASKYIYQKQASAYINHVTMHYVYRAIREFFNM